MSQHVLSSPRATATLQRAVLGSVRQKLSVEARAQTPQQQSRHSRSVPEQQPKGTAHRGRDGGIGGMNQELDPFSMAPMQDPKIRSYKHAPRK